LYFGVRHYKYGDESNDEENDESYSHGSSFLSIVSIAGLLQPIMFSAHTSEPTRDSDWNYPEVADSFRLRHRNLLHRRLLVVRGAQVTQR
jgi:hypothetical protein